MIPRWQQEGLAGLLVEQQEVQNFEDWPLTTETIATALCTIFSAVRTSDSAQTLESLPGVHCSFPCMAPSCYSELSWLWNVFLVFNVDSFSCPHLLCLVLSL